MNNPFKLEFTLKQHTPIIHFQHDQYGATLRATEVKPKLDRFIIKRIGEAEIKQNWKQVWNSKMKSLKYQLIIKGTVAEKYVVASRLSSDKLAQIQNDCSVIAPSPYFAQEQEINNLGTDQSPLTLSRLGIFSTAEIHGCINIFDDELKSKIVNLLPAFFISENFGTRQSKGFGSFSVSKINGNVPPTPVDELLKSEFDFVYRKTGTYSIKDAFQTILRDYKILKSGENSGRNEANRYTKSRLFLYFATKDVRWDKRWMKKQLQPLTIPGQLYDGYPLKQNHPPPTGINGDPIDMDLSQNWNDKVSNDTDSKAKHINYQYIRALLGLAEQFEFQTMNRDKLVVKINTNNSLTRFRSPVLFKLIDSQLYLLGYDNIPTTFLTANSPTFSSYRKNNNRKVNGSDYTFETNITIPGSFSLSEFIRWSLENGPNTDQSQGKIRNYNKI